MSTAAIKKHTNRRRFSDDQIRSLETTFETESRPELRLKQHLASKLGLQPRQVAIWFQNKRARSKSKQIEGQYSVLKSNYDELASQFEALRKENQSLLVQLQRLRKMAEKSDSEENGKNDRVEVGNSENHRFLLDIDGHDHFGGVPSYSDLRRKDYYLDEDANVLDMVRMAEGSLTSPDHGCSFESGTFLDHPGGGGAAAQLWDF